MLKFSTAKGQENIPIPKLAPVWADMIECERLLEVNDTQFGRRTFYRAAFAFTEAYVSWLSDSAIDNVASKGVTSGKIELSLISALLDATPRVDKLGKIRMDPSRTPLINFTALVFRTMAEQRGKKADSFFSDADWSHFHLAVKVRHRVTHPKSPSDAKITDDDMVHIRRSLGWLVRHTSELMAAPRIHQKKH